MSGGAEMVGYGGRVGAPSGGGFGGRRRVVCGV